MPLEEQYYAEAMLRITQSDGQSIAELEAERDEPRQQLAAAQAEALEQARIVGMGGECVKAESKKIKDYCED